MEQELVERMCFKEACDKCRVMEQALLKRMCFEE
jgi:hypothetical protein